MPVTKFPDLETERLALRRLQPGDSGFLLRLWSHPEVQRYMTDSEPIETLEQVEQILREYLSPLAETYNRWLLVLKENGEPVGTCGYHRWDRAHRHAEIGYDLATSYWGAGLMNEALRAVLAHGFEKIDLNRIEAFVTAGNDRSVRALERLGFQHEGTLRAYYYQRGSFYDALVFSLLRREFGA